MVNALDLSTSAFADQIISILTTLSRNTSEKSVLWYVYSVDIVIRIIITRKVPLTSNRWTISTDTQWQEKSSELTLVTKNRKRLRITYKTPKLSAKLNYCCCREVVTWNRNQNKLQTQPNPQRRTLSQIKRKASKLLWTVYVKMRNVYSAGLTSLLLDI